MPSRSFLTFTGLPTLTVLIYSLFFAQATYETESSLIVREAQSEAGSEISGFLPSLAGFRSKTSVEDALILETYLRSGAFLDMANSRFELRQHFSSAPSDPFRRLPNDATSDALHRYLREKITIQATASGIMAVRVRAYTPEVATALIEFMIDQSEEKVNSMNERMVRSQTEVAERQVARSMERLLDANDKLLQFQIDHSMVNPMDEVTAQFTNISGLDTELVQKHTELRGKTQFLQEDAFELRRLRREIQALEEQRAEETRVLVSGGDENMARHLRAYEAIKLQHNFSLEAYSAAVAMAEKVSMEAARQEKFLTIIAPPHLPDDPVFPRPVRSTATVFFVFVIVYGILRLSIATIRDHNV